MRHCRISAKTQELGDLAYNRAGNYVCNLYFLKDEDGQERWTLPKLWLEQSPEKQNTCAKAHFSSSFSSALEPSLVLMLGDCPAYSSSEMGLFQSLVLNLFTCI